MKKFILLLGMALFASAGVVFAEDAPVEVATPSDNTQMQTQDQSVQNTSSPSTTDNSSLPLDQRVAILERQLSAANQVGLMNQINDLQNQVQELQGQVEQLSHTVQTLQSQSTTQYADLDQRMSKLGNNSTTANTSANDAQASPAPSTTANNTNEQQDYEAAYDKVKNGNYSDAIVNLKKFIGQYPSGIYAPNAHYWLGQMYLLKGDGRNAAKEFDLVIKQYPKNPKIKDAKLKLGFAYLLLNKNTEAKVQFKRVIAEYPDSSTAKLAKARLAEIA